MLTSVNLGQELLLDDVQLLSDCRLPLPNLRQIDVVIFRQFLLEKEEDVKARFHRQHRSRLRGSHDNRRFAEKSQRGNISQELMVMLLKTENKSLQLPDSPLRWIKPTCPKAMGRVTRSKAIRFLALKLVCRRAIKTIYLCVACLHLLDVLPVDSDPLCQLTFGLCDGLALLPQCLS